MSDVDKQISPGKILMYRLQKIRHKLNQAYNEQSIHRNQLARGTRYIQNVLTLVSMACFFLRGKRLLSASGVPCKLDVVQP